MENKNDRIAPRWLTLANAATYTGVSKRLIEIWDHKGLITTSRIITPGNVRGRTLVCRASLDAFVESYVGKAPTVIAMNAQKGGRA